MEEKEEIGQRLAARRKGEDSSLAIVEKKKGDSQEVSK